MKRLIIEGRNIADWGTGNSWPLNVGVIGFCLLMLISIGVVVSCRFRRSSFSINAHTCTRALRICDFDHTLNSATVAFAIWTPLSEARVIAMQWCDNFEDKSCIIHAQRL